MSASLVDTNLLSVANGRAEQVDLACYQSCAQHLMAIQRHGLLLLDDGLRILTEYRANASMSGAPGLGDAFLRWAWDNQANTDFCLVVPITPHPIDPNGFAEFPADPDLAGFDRSDRKFVAVARASGLNPTIYNATDTDWWLHRTALSRNGVKLEFICPQLMSR